ncbi:hypothetical protein [Chryseobacterium lineare]
MENRVKHYYSISSIVIGKNNEYQFNFYAGDYLKKESNSFGDIKEIDQKEVLAKIDFFIKTLPSKGIDFLAQRSTDSNFLGYSFGVRESGYYRYGYLFFANRTEIVELRGKSRKYLEDIVEGYYDEELELIREQAVLVNCKQEPMAYYSAFI